MKKVFTFILTLLSLLLLAGYASRAQENKDIYRAAPARLQEIGDNNATFQQTIQGATVIQPGGANRLQLTVRLPAASPDSVPNDSAGVFIPVQLNLDINPAEIQQVLTSMKLFSTTGQLTIRGMTKPVSVKYMPTVSGTEQKGNFNIFITIQFNGSDFDLPGHVANPRFVLTVFDAKVNRV